MEAHAPFRRISCEAAEAVIARADTIILDVRNEAIFARGHIDGAVNLLIKDICEVVETTPRNRRLLIYCQHGNESREYARSFCHFGFSNVYVLDGGYDAWSRRSRSGPAALQEDYLAGALPEYGSAVDEINAAKADSLTPLMKACNEGNTAVVEKLIAAGVNLNATNADGNNALWLACAGDNLHVIRILISAGIDIDNRNDGGATALIYAASAGKDAVVELLLNLGADPTPETLDGLSALDLASTLECLALLRRNTRIGREPSLSNPDLLSLETPSHEHR